MNFECWAIRQKSTGFFLPMRWKRSRGYSFDIPSPNFPRLFKSEKSANIALRAWLQGEWREKEYDYDEWSHSEFQIGCSPVKIEGRDREDMEVVKFALKLEI